jgi:hypothetical protein
MGVMWIGGDGEDKKGKRDQDRENQKPQTQKNRKRIEGKGRIEGEEEAFGVLCVDPV